MGRFERNFMYGLKKFIVAVIIVLAIMFFLMYVGTKSAMELVDGEEEKGIEKEVEKEVEIDKVSNANMLEITSYGN